MAPFRSLIPRNYRFGLPAARGELTFSSVRKGGVSNLPVALSMQDAIKQGIQFNLGAIGAGEAFRRARLQRLAAISVCKIAFSVGVKKKSAHVSRLSPRSYANNHYLG